MKREYKFAPTIAKKTKKTGIIYYIKYTDNGAIKHKAINQHDPCRCTYANCLHEKYADRALKVFKGEAESSDILNLFTAFLNDAKDKNRYSAPYTKSIEYMFKRILTFCASRGITEIPQFNEKVIKEYISYLRDEHKNSNTTINLHLRQIRVVFNFGISKGLISCKNPLSEQGKERHEKLIPKPDQKSYNIYTDEELEILLNELDYPYNKICQLIYYCALRMSEALNLTWDKVRKDYSEISISKNEKTGWSPKWDKNRDVATGKIASDVLKYQKKWQSDNEIESDYVFCDINGKMICFQTLQKAVRELVKKLEFKGMFPESGDSLAIHSLRHKRITYLANETGFPLKVISDYVGHSTVVMTERYCHKVVQVHKLLADS